MPIEAFTQQELAERFDYNPETGELIHKRGRFKGKVAGTPQAENDGYRHLCLSKGGKAHNVTAHRLIWLLVHGEVPPKGMVIDHIDGNPDNNRLDNLRVVSQRENTKNRGRRKKKIDNRYVHTSVFGVKYDKKENCYVVTAENQEILRTLDFDDAKYARWNWEYDNGFSDRH